jgi:hypothetical protein
VLRDLGYDPDTCHVEQLISWLELWDGYLGELGELNALLESVKENADIESLLPPLPQRDAVNSQQVKRLCLLIKSILRYKVNEPSPNNSPAKFLLLSQGKRTDLGSTKKEMPEKL